MADRPRLGRECYKPPRFTVCVCQVYKTPKAPSMHTDTDAYDDWANMVTTRCQLYELVIRGNRYSFPLGRAVCKQVHDMQCTWIAKYLIIGYT